MTKLAYEKQPSLMDKLLMKNVAPRMTKQQISNSLQCLQKCIDNLEEAQQELVKSDFAYPLELDGIGRIRASLTDRIGNMQKFADTQQR